MSRLPPDFKLPRGNLQTAWISYCCWDKRKKIPPLRAVYGREMNRKLTSRFTRFCKLMEAIVNQAKTQNVWKEPEDEKSALDILRSVNLSAVIPPKTRTNRQRRLDQLSWSTLANDYYENQHRLKLTHQSNSDDDFMHDDDDHDDDDHDDDDREG